jgi:hypothetical protein
VVCEDAVPAVVLVEGVVDGVIIFSCFFVVLIFVGLFVGIVVFRLRRPRSLNRSLSRCIDDVFLLGRKYMFLVLVVGIADILNA